MGIGTRRSLRIEWPSAMSNDHGRFQSDGGREDEDWTAEMVSDGIIAKNAKKEFGDLCKAQWHKGREHIIST